MSAFHIVDTQISSYTLESKEYKMTGWFEFSKSSDEQYWFVLKAANAETILTSELYKAKTQSIPVLLPRKTIAPWMTCTYAWNPRMISITSI